MKKSGKIAWALLATGLCFGNLLASKVTVSSYGYSSTDATTFLRAALNSSYDTVVIDRVGSGIWLTGPLLLTKNNRTLIFENGVVLEALPGMYSTNDNLIKATNVHNVQLTGYGNATLKMQKAEYILLNDSEWRHCLGLFGCHNIRIEGFKMMESGGDGLYVGAGCSNISVKNCWFENNYRQGVSVIDVDTLLLEHCRMSNTKGTPPEDGLDIEPWNPASQILRNIEIRECSFENNNGSGIQVGLFETNDQNISIKFKDCYVAGNEKEAISIGDAYSIDTLLTDGTIVMENVVVKDSKTPGIYVRKRYDKLSLVFRNCILLNTGYDLTQPYHNAPIVFEILNYSLDHAYGGVTFDKMLIIDSFARSPFSMYGPAALKGVHGNIQVFNEAAAPVNWFWNSTTDTADITLNTAINDLNTYTPYQITTTISPARLFETGCDSSGLITSVIDSVRAYPTVQFYHWDGTARIREDCDYLTGCTVLPANTGDAIRSIHVRKDFFPDSTETLTAGAVSFPLYSNDNTLYSCTISDTCAVSGISPVENEPEREIYPNPATDMVQITGNNPVDYIALFDTRGRLLMQEKHTDRMRLGQLPAGVYIIRYKQGNELNSQKLVIKR